MLSRLLREFLFFLVHWIVNKLVAIQNVYHQLCVIKSKLLNFHKGEETKQEVLKILQHMPRMQKSLKHLVMLADTNHHSADDLASLVIWSLVSGVPYLTFYDITGDLKRNEKKIFIAVEKKKKGIPGCIKWSDKPDLNGYTNGCQAYTIIINILEYNDGRPKIAQFIRNIAKDKSLCRRNSKEFTAQELSNALYNIYPSIPEPDIALYTGPLCCTYGMLPWQIRLTEILQLSPNHSIDADSYIGALYRYNKCEQRFGT